MKTTLIRVGAEDLKIARSIGLNKLIEDNPQLVGLKVSDRLLFKRMVKYFIED